MVFSFFMLLSHDKDLLSGYLDITKMFSRDNELINHVFRNIKWINKRLITFHITLYRIYAKLTFAYIYLTLAEAAG